MIACAHAYKPLSRVEGAGALAIFTDRDIIFYSLVLMSGGGGGYSAFKLKINNLLSCLEALYLCLG